MQLVQSAWVVSNLEDAARHWVETLGVGPFFVNQEIRFETASYRGQPSDITFRSAVAHSGGIQIEFIEQNDNRPSVYRDSVPLGQSAFHHKAAFVDDMDETVRRFEEMGAPLVFDGSFAGARLGYVDTRARLGFMLELLVRNDLFLNLFERVALAAENWNGDDPVRPFSNLNL